MAPDEHVVILGAGVIGLQTAVSLLEAGYRVTILAKHYPGDESIAYTSPWAGAHWRSHADLTDHEQQLWDIETYNHWLTIIARELNQPDMTMISGLGLYDSLFYSASPEPPWFAKDVLSFKQLPEKALPTGIKHGHTYTSIMINVPMYLQYLLDSAISLGARTIRATLPRSTRLAGSLSAASEIISSHFRSKDEPARPVAAFVNATGLSARYLVPDDGVFPIRGQTVLVRGTARRITTLDGPPTPSTAGNDGRITYVLPRPHAGLTVLGGTKQPGEWTAAPDPATTQRILAEAKKWAPELLDAEGRFEVVAVNVGLRPGRKGGARVEVEELDAGDGSVVVCHAYGHAGAGYQNSVGCARKVVRLLNARFCDTGKGAAGAVAKL